MKRDVEVWRYRLPRGQFDCGGVVLIDSTGLFSAVTDFGNYAHWWPGQHCGYPDFRLFIHKLAGDCGEGYHDYFLGKVRGRKTAIDWKDLRNKLNVRIFEAHKKHVQHKKRGCSNTHCSWREWSPLTSRCHYENCDLAWRNRMLAWVKNMSNESDLQELYYTSSIPDLDFCDLIHYDWDGQSLSFSREMMPRLREMLESELKEEGLL